MLPLGSDPSAEGVQRDLLPLIEGSVVSTKHGPVATDHMLFIASGAFTSAKPSDMMAELQVGAQGGGTYFAKWLTRERVP